MPEGAAPLSSRCCCISLEEGKSESKAEVARNAHTYGYHGLHGGVDLSQSVSARTHVSLAGEYRLDECAGRGTVLPLRVGFVQIRKRKKSLIEGYIARSSSTVKLAVHDSLVFAL